jgi:hypothetical protein
LRKYSSVPNAAADTPNLVPSLSSTSAVRRRDGGGGCGAGAASAAAARVAALRARLLTGILRAERTQPRSLRHVHARMSVAATVAAHAAACARLGAAAKAHGRRALAQLRSREAAGGTRAVHSSITAASAAAARAHAAGCGRVCFGELYRLTALVICHACDADWHGVLVTRVDATARLLVRVGNAQRGASPQRRTAAPLPRPRAASCDNTRSHRSSCAPARAPTRPARAA